MVSYPGVYKQHKLKLVGYGGRKGIRGENRKVFRGRGRYGDRQTPGRARENSVFWEELGVGNRGEYDQYTLPDIIKE